MKNQEPIQILGGITASDFLNEYWQKKPLLIRKAIPGFTGLLSPDELAGLACEEEVQSRIVEEINGCWKVMHGPFNETEFARLPYKKNPAHRWTLLVQSVNHYLHEASELLQNFNFIPHARLDDLMVSYAPDGGGVGPHFDSYDVFLLQGQGKRLWRISEQTDLTLVKGAPLRILKNFNIAQEWILEAGDMLYLPPHLAHWGIAISENDIDCMTYSIGFRAPKNQELATEFLGYMQDKLNQDHIIIDGIYQDADLTLQQHPAEISAAMITKVASTLQKISWDQSDIADFLGRYLSEPKADIYFTPNKNTSLANFKKQILTYGLELDLKSQMLFRNNKFYMNGEPYTIDDIALSSAAELADQRRLDAAQINNCTHGAWLKLLHTWNKLGYLHVSYNQ